MRVYATAYLFISNEGDTSRQDKMQVGWWQLQVAVGQ